MNNLQSLEAYTDTAMNQKTMYQINDEEWTSYYAERTALLMGLAPELRTQETLSVINRTIGSEYIMLYDENVNEIVSSNKRSLVDPDVGSPDWIELYNTSSSAILLYTILSPFALYGFAVSLPRSISRQSHSSPNMGMFSRPASSS